MSVAKLDFAAALALVSVFIVLACIAYALCYMTGNLGRGLSLKKQKIGPN